MNRGQLVFETSRSLGLDDTAASDELILMQRWFNRGIVDILERTRCYVDIGTMALQANITDYRITSDILAVLNLTTPDQSGNPNTLDVIAMSDLIPMLSQSAAPSANPSYASVEGNLLRVAPAPSGAAVLTYYYVPKPTEASADGTTAADSADPSTATYGGIPTEYHDALLMYMIWRGAEFNQQGGGFYRGKAYASGAAYKSEYVERCTEIRDMHRRKAGRGLSPGKVGYPDRDNSPQRNDVYPNYSR